MTPLYSSVICNHLKLITFQNLHPVRDLVINKTLKRPTIKSLNWNKQAETNKT